MKRWPREKTEDSGPPNPSFQGYPRVPIITITRKDVSGEAMECPWLVPWREEQVDESIEAASGSRPDAGPVAKAATLHVARQDARSASDGTSAGGEACVRIMHRRLMAAVPADSAVRRSEKSDVVSTSVRDRRAIRRRGNGVR